MSVLSNARVTLENLSDGSAIAVAEALLDVSIFGQGTMKQRPEGGVERVDPTKLVIARVEERLWIDPTTRDYLEKCRDEGREDISVIVHLTARTDRYGVPLYMGR